MSDDNAQVQGHNVTLDSNPAEVVGSGIVPRVPESDQSGVQSKTETQTGDVQTTVQTDARQNEQRPIDTPPNQDVSSDIDDLGYESIDDPAISSIASVFKESGVHSDAALKLFEKALDSGNVQDVDSKGIIDALGEVKGNMIIAAVKSVFYENAQKSAEIQSKFMNTVGGEDAWKHIQQWIHTKESQDTEFKNLIDNYRELVNKDTASAMLVANALKSMYRDSNVTRKPSAFVQGDSRNTTLGYTPILDQQDFGRQYSKARREGKYSQAEEILARWRMGGGKTK